ncbi:MAG: PAS domain-containing protein, partial [Gammaproteobacteria bacterium]|nr:PAS domain-containing protein [Gammaproteobacteria bacterium]
MISKIFDNLNTAILCLDNRLRCRFINSAAEILLDISGSRSRGLKVTGLFVDSDDLESVLLESLTSGQPFTRRQAEIKLLNTQPITVDYTVSVFRDTMQNMLLLEMFPMSRYIRIDRDEILRDHQDATRQMVRGMAHEIKNPLGGIRGSAQLLQKQLNDPKLAEYTSIIVDEADRLTRLVDRMLGPNTLPKTSVSNIHEQLEKVATLLDTETGSRIEIARDYDPSIPDFAFDSELIVQTLLNIARNA